MRFAVTTISLLVLHGCGSCLDEKTSEPSPATPPSNTIVVRPGVDGGPRRFLDLRARPGVVKGTVDAGEP